MGRGRFRGKGGHLLLPPHPHTALPTQCYERTLVIKKALDFVWLITYRHHCTVYTEPRTLSTHSSLYSKSVKTWPVLKVGIRTWGHANLAVLNRSTKDGIFSSKWNVRGRKKNRNNATTFMIVTRHFSLLPISAKRGVSKWKTCLFPVLNTSFINEEKYQ